MKRLWILLVLALAVSIASIPQTGWAQSLTDVVEKVTVESLGLKGLAVTGIAVNESGHYFAATFGGLFSKSCYVWRSKDSGKSWVQLKNGLEKIPFGDVRAIAIVDSQHVIIGTMEDVFKSTDNGDSWHPVKAEGTLGTERNIRARQFLRKANAIFTVGFGSGFWRSDDNGWSWQQVSLVDSTFPATQTITMTPSGTLFVGTGSADKGTGVFRSTDDGRTWVQVNNGLDNGKSGALSSLNIWRLAASHSGSSKTVIASTAYAGIYRTDDEGNTWYKVENLPIIIGGDVTICTPGIFVNGWNSSGDATYRSTNNGVSWTKIPELNGYEVWSFFQLSSTKLMVGTHDGIFLANFDIIATPVEENPTIPTAFQLSQNYPNPFNPSTTIEFSIPERSFVKLTIHNLLGQEIEALVSEEKEAGTYRLEWNAGNLPSGVYLYKLGTSKFQNVKKMLLMK